MSLVRIIYGQKTAEFRLAAGQLVPGRRGAIPEPLADPAAAMRQALEAPLGFPPLVRALTPDDHVAVVLPERLDSLPELLPPILELLVSAGIDPGRITLIFPPGDRGGRPAGGPQVAVEVHDPDDRKKLSYLASTKAGRRIYLNRTLVDADQIIVLGRLGYDPILGYGGGLGDVFPVLSDAETRREFAARVTDAPPGGKSWPAELEAREVGWLLGMPFLVQVLEAEGGAPSRVLAGAAEPVADEGKQLLDRHWRWTVDQAAGLVITSLSGDRQTFADLARALAVAARVVRPGGKIAVLSELAGELGESARELLEAESAAQGLALARPQNPRGAVAVWELARASRQAQLYLLSKLSEETAEGLFLIPLARAAQVQKLLDAADTCLVLPEGQRALAVLAETSRGRRQA